MKKWSDLIFEGKKKYELRKRLPEEITEVYVYESRGCGMIVGKLIVSSLYCLPLDKLWELTKDRNCVGKEDFKEYYTGKEKGVAIGIKEAILFPKPIPLSQFGFKTAPQNYYIIEK